jgi:hypothetical protein
MRDDILKPDDQIGLCRPPGFHLFQPFNRFIEGFIQAGLGIHYRLLYV